MTPCFETSGEVTGFVEIRISESVFKCELDLGIGSGVWNPPASGDSGGGGGVRGWTGLRASTFETEFFVVEEKLVGLESW